FPQAYNAYWVLCPPSEATQPPDNRPRQSWAALILPYVEQGNLYATGAVNAQQKGVPVFLCPGDARGDRGSEGGSYAFLGNRFGLTSYLAVEGSSYERGHLDTYVNLGLVGPRDGVLYGSSDTRMTDITDGTSQTLLLGERPPSPAPALDWGWWGWSVYDSSLAAVDNRTLAYGGDCPRPATYGPRRPNESGHTHPLCSAP